MNVSLRRNKIDIISDVNEEKEVGDAGRGSNTGWGASGLGRTEEREQKSSSPGGASGNVRDLRWGLGRVVYGRRF